ncbi:MAG: phosphoheptose isomerase [Planctomycetes bacterium SM23_32]|nr:MAG: phosphoheptose isomerase [Planctomycetes bacterium SM23_32]
MKQRIEAILRETIGLHEALIAEAPRIGQMARRIAEALARGGTLYVMGNGGSAADAQHMAGELVGRFLLEGRAPLPCLALSTDTSVLTAVGNDFGMDQVFVRQVQAYVREGDAVLGISTSGNSPNVVLAVEEAHRRGAVTLGLLGGDGGELASACDLAVVVPARTSPRIQEGHATVVHILCELVEEALVEPST